MLPTDITPGSRFLPRRGQRAALVAGVLFALLGTPREVFAGPKEILQDASRTYARGRYKQVIERVRPLLYPTIKLSDQEQVISAHRLLALSYMFLKDKVPAEKHFLAILSLRPRYELDPVVDPVAAVELFDEVKRRNAERIKAILERERKEQERKRLEALRRKKELERKRLEALLARPKTERVIEKRRYWINWIPFGAGQLQNGHTKKGFTLLGLQAGLAAASLGLYIGEVSLINEKGLVPDKDWNTARGLMYAQIATGAACIGLMIYGVVDALIYYKPDSVTIRSIKQKVPPATGPAKKKSTWYIAPTLGPGSAGLGIGVAF